ncbi:hypothetical protein V501_04734 [Pseudogymnoascus sp. VKM F-4519 (FW-2642)]|nr:hypothetical protein V501_04734 [Pseudogymnoascus sp. VKM F-4519 (FW-2642)]
MPPILGLRQASANPSFLSILRSLVFTYPVTQELLTSSTFKLINPQNHVIVTDQVSVCLPASSISGLSDEAVLALFTRGFFGGKVFAIERLYMKLGGWKTIPTGYSGKLLASGSRLHGVVRSQQYRLQKPPDREDRVEPSQYPRHVLYARGRHFIWGISTGRLASQHDAF